MVIDSRWRPPPRRRPPSPVVRAPRRPRARIVPGVPAGAPEGRDGRAHGTAVGTDCDRIRENKELVKEQLFPPRLRRGGAFTPCRSRSSEVPDATQTFDLETGRGGDGCARPAGGRPPYRRPHAAARQNRPAQAPAEGCRRRLEEGQRRSRL